MNRLRDVFSIAKKLKKFLALLLFTVPVFCSAQEKDVDNSSLNNIIPKPVFFRLRTSKTVIITNKTVIVADKQFLAQATYLQQQIETQTGLHLSLHNKPPKNAAAVVLGFDNQRANKPEMYVFDIKSSGVKIVARDVMGIVHGIQTLLQLLPLKAAENISLPALSIEDYPRFRYRGMHLDVSRHFFPVSFIKKYIDYLTFHKFNTFHWHLTDDQGWRIQIKSYPKLTEVGAWRDSTLIGHFRDTPARYDRTRYGGFYTQDEIKDIIHYAAIRGITIIPEIDIPGHSRAAIAAYPELSTNPDTTWDVATAWGMFNRQNNVLAPNEKTFAFLKAVFGEIADLFPSPYIHVGGDECSKIWWKADPRTQAFMKEHDLKDETALQTYFIEQAIADVTAKGKKVIGWDEILEPGLDTSAIIMNWRGVKAAITAAQNGHEVIMSPGKPLYFDYYQSKQKDSLAIGGYTPWDSVYLFEPIPAQIAAQGLSKQVLGVQANVWTEYMAYPSKVEYMIFPRMTALSEVLWTDKNRKNINDFKRRLEQTAVPRYQFWNSSYYKNFDNTSSQ
ncbi:beta-N-acetylhexosaminidase [Flavisolibacter ginsenosidimutans]|uniref:beta-N-acetylhexosaminidase n=1 Tax=Flavisolibacter ginsenosidimutans TaxID=661481 RepID=A0A5B8UJI8_9BACT|nr:beta-N-acetylhexosaminidase [Flavisolibacter ginsenosidimutans]QEC56309.1 beta-N-acetylhexosaminidase [Flavisolibacter ginsenosidimutans]